jgi:zinc transport system permease protein
MSGFLPIYGAIIAAILSALIIGWVYLRFKEREDAVISMIWSVGMAIGVLFVAKTPGYNVELNHFLLGNILWVTPHDLWILGALNAAILLSVLVFHKHFLALLFDEKHAELQGVKVKSLFLFLLVLISLSIVVLIQTVGIILVLSMLVLPAAIAEVFTRRLSLMMVIATFLNVAFSVGGLSISYRLDLPPGATIALFAGLIYLLSLRFKKSAR